MWGRRLPDTPQVQVDPPGPTNPVSEGPAPEGRLHTFRNASFCSRCLLIMGVTWSVSELGPSLSAPPHQSSSLLYSCSRLSRTLQTCGGTGAGFSGASQQGTRGVTSPGLSTKAIAGHGDARGLFRTRTDERGLSCLNLPCFRMYI